jgi:hypothetical protein
VSDKIDSECSSADGEADRVRETVRGPLFVGRRAMAATKESIINLHTDNWFCSIGPEGNSGCKRKTTCKMTFAA